MTSEIYSLILVHNNFSKKGLSKINYVTKKILIWNHYSTGFEPVNLGFKKKSIAGTAL